MLRLSPLDRLLVRLDRGLRAATRTGLVQQRPNPAGDLPDPPLAAADRRRAAGLMRVNHAGEVCAQALYVGQALLARDDATAAALFEAAGQEGDHLHWCERRLAELGSHPSRLNALWFAGSYVLGAVAGAVGDRVSLGFVEETERQVVAHLEGHLGRLPEDDQRSRAIVDSMRTDEAGHADAAARRGARRPPVPVRRAMAWCASLMTRSAYWI